MLLSKYIFLNDKDTLSGSLCLSLALHHTLEDLHMFTHIENYLSFKQLYPLNAPAIIHNLDVKQYVFSATSGLSIKTKQIKKMM